MSNNFTAVDNLKNSKTENLSSNTVFPWSVIPPASIKISPGSISQASSTTPIYLSNPSPNFDYNVYMKNKDSAKFPLTNARANNISFTDRLNNASWILKKNNAQSFTNSSDFFRKEDYRSFKYHDHKRRNDFEKDWNVKRNCWEWKDYDGKRRYI